MAEDLTNVTRSPITEELRTLAQFRTDNPGKFDDVPDTQLATWLNKKYNAGFQKLPSSSAIGRTLGRGSVALQDLGQWAGSKIRPDPNKLTSEYSMGENVRDVIGRGVEMLVSNLPEQAATLAALYFTKKNPSIGNAILAGTAGAAGARTYLETDSVPEAVRATVSVPMSALGASKAAKFTRGYMQYSSPAKQALASAGASYLGGLVGDASTLWTTESGQQILSDPRQLAAYAISQVPMAGADVVQNRGMLSKKAREAYQRGIETLEAHVAKTTSEQAKALRETPPEQRDASWAERLQKVQQELIREDALRAEQSAESEAFRVQQAVDGDYTTGVREVVEGRRANLFVPTHEVGKLYLAPFESGFFEFKTRKGTVYSKPDANPITYLESLGLDTAPEAPGGTPKQFTSEYAGPEFKHLIDSHREKARMVFDDKTMNPLEKTAAFKKLNDDFLIAARPVRKGMPEIVTKEPSKSEAPVSQEQAGRPKMHTQVDDLIALIRERQSQNQPKGWNGDVDSFTGKIVHDVLTEYTQGMELNASQKAELKALKTKKLTAQQLQETAYKFINDFPYSAVWRREAFTNRLRTIMQNPDTRFTNVRDLLHYFKAQHEMGQVTPTDDALIQASSNFLQNIYGKDLKFVAFDQSQMNYTERFTRGVADYTQRGIFVRNERVANLQQKLKLAGRITSHELAHFAWDDYAATNPEGAKNVSDFIFQKSPKEVKKILSELNEILSPNELLDNIDYLSGVEVDEKGVPTVRDADRPGEFVSAISELLYNHAASRDFRPAKLAKAFEPLPFGLHKYIEKFGMMVKKFIYGEDSVLNLMAPDDANTVKKLLGNIVEAVSANSAQFESNVAALQRLGIFSSKEATNFLNRSNIDPQISNVRRQLGQAEMPSAMRSMAKRALDDIKFKESKKDGRIANNFLLPLWRAVQKPFLRNAFNTLQRFVPQLRQANYESMSILGQNADGTLGLKDALSATKRIIREFAMDKSWQSKSEKAWLENQKRIKAAEETGGTAEPLTEAQMMSEFGMDEKQARFTKRVTDMVGESNKRFMQLETEIDNTYLSQILMAKNGKMVPAEVAQRAGELTRQADNIGKLAYEVETYKKILNSRKKQGVASELDAKLANEVKMREDAMGQLTQAFKDTFAASFPELHGGVTEGDLAIQARFSDGVARTAVQMAKARAEYTLKTRQAGYLPMTRRGRYLLSEFTTNEAGESVPKEVRGFETKKAMDDYLAKRKAEGDYDPSKFEAVDKEIWSDKAKMFNSQALQQIRMKAMNELREAVAGLRGDLEGNKAGLDALDALMKRYDPLDTEIKEILAVKGDKFKLRRNFIEGFETNDFLPNALEYVQYKNTDAHKRLTRAKVNLEYMQSIVQDDPILLDRLNKEKDYALGPTTEWTKLRKLAFMNYLGFSFRNFVANSTQTFFNTIPALQANGASYLEAWGSVTRAATMSLKWQQKGTTGNRALDVLLKKAESEGAIMPTAIEAFSPSIDETSTLVESLMSYERGNSVLGQRVRNAAADTTRGLERFMRCTAFASEVINRRIAFLSSASEQLRRNPAADLQEVYNNAFNLVSESNFVGDKSNRPGLITQQTNPTGASHGLALTATAMQTFVWNHLNQLQTYYKLGYAGKNANARRAFRSGMVHLGLAAGLTGMPFASTLNYLIGGIFKERPSEFLKDQILSLGEMIGMDEEWSGRISDGLLKGVPAMLGTDTGSTIGLGDPFFQYQGKEPTLSDIAGPVGGTIKQLFNAGATVVETASVDPFNVEMWQQAITKGMRAGAPKALDQLVKMADAITTGDYKNRDGSVVKENLGMESIPGLLTGFTPMEVTKSRESLRQLEERRNYRQENQKLHAETIARMLLEGERTQNMQYMMSAQEATQTFLSDNDTINPIDFQASVLASYQRLRQQPKVSVSSADLDDYATILRRYPDIKSRLTAPFEEAQTALRVAGYLGQPEVLAAKLKALPSAARRQATMSGLTQAGLPAPAVSGFQRSGMQQRLLIEALRRRGLIPSEPVETP